MANHNGKKPTSNPNFETSPVRCGRCKHVFEHYKFEVIDDLVQLRCGDTLLLRAEIICLHCGSLFAWTIRERDIEDMAIHYKKLLDLVKYAPE